MLFSIAAPPIGTARQKRSANRLRGAQRIPLDLPAAEPSFAGRTAPGTTRTIVGL